MNPLHLAQEAISLEPRLTAFGLGIYSRSRRDAAQEFIRLRNRLLSREGLMEVALCAQWLRDGHATGERGSYGLKHEVENYYGVYITNGALIAAALGMGFEYRVDGPNVALALPCEARSAQVGRTA